MPYATRTVLLRHGPPWGFRLIDHRPGLSVSKVRRNSPAESAGLQEGDAVVAINNIPAFHMTHAKAIEVIDTGPLVLSLTIGRNESNYIESVFVECAQSPPPAWKESSKLIYLNYHAPEDEEGQEQDHEEAEQQQRYDLPLEEEEEHSDMYDTNDTMIIPFSDDVQPISLKKLQTPAQAPLISPNRTRKAYADSSFYHDPKQYYPTIEEQKQMAKYMAKSLTANTNQTSKGAAMFERRRMRSNKWIALGTEEEESDMEQAEVESFYEPPESSVPVLYGADIETTIPDDTPLPLPPPPPPPPPPGYPGLVPDRSFGVKKSQPLLSLHAAAGAPKTEKEYIEKVRSYPRSKHNILPPEVSFDIAAALHSGKGRGAQIFAKRRQRSLKWENTSQGQGIENHEPQAKHAMLLGSHSSLNHHAPVQVSSQNLKLKSKFKNASVTSNTQEEDNAQSKSASIYPIGRSVSVSSTSDVGWRPVSFSKSPKSTTIHR